MFEKILATLIVLGVIKEGLPQGWQVPVILLVGLFLAVLFSGYFQIEERIKRSLRPR